MEVEAVTHALHWSASRGDSQTTHAIILTDSRALLQRVKNAIGSPDRHVSNAVILTDSVGLLQRVKSGTGSPDRHVSVSVPDIHLHKAFIPSGLRLERSQVLRSLRHYLRAKSKNIALSIAWRKEAWKEGALDNLP